MVLTVLNTRRCIPCLILALSRAYRSLKRLVKLYFSTNDSKAVLENYQKLLNFANGKTITENDLFKVYLYSRELQVSDASAGHQ